MSAVILFVRRSASDARSRTLVLTAVAGGATVTSAVIFSFADWLPMRDHAHWY